VRTGRLIPQRYNGKPAPVPRGLVDRLKLLARRSGLDQVVRRARRAATGNRKGEPDHS
jgi:hypothetical protein